MTLTMTRAVAPSDIEAVMDAVRQMAIGTVDPGREGLGGNARPGHREQVRYASANAREALRAELLEYLAERQAGGPQP